jgi:hypothetical protein
MRSRGRATIDLCIPSLLSLIAPADRANPLT